jgi:hypothetical protein
MHQGLVVLHMLVLEGKGEQVTRRQAVTPQLKVATLKVWGTRCLNCSGRNKSPFVCRGETLALASK